MRDARFAMRLSLIVGLAMLIGKTTAYFMTHSAAIFSDAAESVVHVIAVGFASFSLRLSAKPASRQFLYGYCLLYTSFEHFHFDDRFGMLFSAQEFIDANRRAFAVGHAVDNQARPEHAVASGEDAIG